MSLTLLQPTCLTRQATLDGLSDETSQAGFAYDCLLNRGEKKKVGLTERCFCVMILYTYGIVPWPCRNAAYFFSSSSSLWFDWISQRNVKAAALWTDVLTAVPLLLWRTVFNVSAENCLNLIRKYSLIVQTGHNTTPSVNILIVPIFTCKKYYARTWVTNKMQILCL